MILHWTQEKYHFVMKWMGPNKVSSSAITSLEDITPKIAVITGPSGKDGDPGPPGPPGVPGDGSATFIFNAPEALSTWLIPHNQQKYPSVTVVDSAGRVLLGEVVYLDNNLVEIAFAFPVSGTAYLN